jgi:hypothetical protein
VLCFSFVLFRIVYAKLSTSLDCHFWIALWYSLTFSYRRLTFSQIVFVPPRFHPNIIILPVLFAIPAKCFCPISTQWLLISMEKGEIYDRCLSFRPFTLLFRAIVLSVLLRFTDCNYPLIYFSCYICVIFFTCKATLSPLYYCNNWWFQ